MVESANAVDSPTGSRRGRALPAGQARLLNQTGHNKNHLAANERE